MSPLLRHRCVRGEGGRKKDEKNADARTPISRITLSPEGVFCASSEEGPFFLFVWRRHEEKGRYGQIWESGQKQPKKVVKHAKALFL